MTTITAKVIADSITRYSRLTTMELCYPRCIHSEFMTHRQLSRNAGGSRAIPVAKLIEAIERDPFIPLHWGKNQKGMQAREEHGALVNYHDHQWTNEVAWMAACKNAVYAARAFAEAGYHKQIVNRLLEPFAHIKVVVSSTTWSNFFALRDHDDAEPHIRLLARTMRHALGRSYASLKSVGEWHLPYLTPQEYIDFSGQFDGFTIAAKISAARCARVSYLTHDGTVPTGKDDLALYEFLANATPLHASPLEHQATPDYYVDGVWRNFEEHGNFNGWRQFRKMHEGECQ